MILGVPVRGEGTSWPLLLHLLSAFVLVGAMIAIAALTICALRAAGPRAVLLRELGFRVALLLVLPSYVLLYGFGIWLADKQFDEDEPDWLEIAFPLTDLTGILGVVALIIVQWWLLRRAREGRSAGWAGGLAAALPLVSLGLLTAVLFLMTAKP